MLNTKRGGDVPIPLILRFQPLLIIFSVFLFNTGSTADAEDSGSPAAAAPWINDETPPPNVILITLDTLRADRLGCYGYDRETSSELDKFAKTATFYPHAIASGSWTLPTHASIFTGLHAFEHGSHVNKREAKGKVYEQIFRLDHKLPSLPKVFRSLGYKTRGIVCNFVYLKEKWGFNNAFDDYTVIKKYWASSLELNKQTFSWLEQNKDEPFFLFLNYFDTHRNYNATKREGFLEHAANVRISGYISTVSDEILSEEINETDKRLRFISDVYDLAVTNQDEQLGLLFEKLRELDLYDNTLIVITADHGEYIGEHYLIEHGKDVYQDVVGVPLVIKAPGQQEGMIEEKAVSHVDIPWFIFSEMPKKYFKKHSEQFPYRPGNHPVITENYYGGNSGPKVYPKYFKRFDRIRTAIYQWPWKYIHSTNSEHELYNLESDPVESSNIIDDHPAKVERLDGILEKFKASRKRTGRQKNRVIPKLTDTDLEEMKALGYL